MSKGSLFGLMFSLLMFAAISLGNDSVPTFNGKTAAQWLEQLKDKDAGARTSAAAALGVAGPKLAGTVPPLIQAAADKDPLVRSAAVAALASFPKDAEKTVPAMWRCLKDKEIKVRVTAVAALGTIAPSANKVVMPALVAALRNDDVRIRVLAAEFLGGLKADALAAVPALIECLDQKPVVGTVDGKAFVLNPAASARGALLAIGEPAIPVLLRSLKGRAGDYVDEVLALMVANATANNGKMSPAVAAIIPALVKAERAGALRLCGPVAAAELRTLRTAALKRSDNIAASLLARDDAEGLAIVIAALKDKNPKVRLAAADGLGRIEQHARLTLEEPKTFKDKLKWAEMVRDGAVPELIRLLKDKDRDVRVACAYSLGNLGALDGTVVPALTETFKGKDVDVQKAAVQSLGKIKTDAAMLGLVEAFRSKDSEVRAKAGGELRTLGRSAIPALTKATKDNDPNVAKMAQMVLDRIP